jgi:SanA protein
MRKLWWAILAGIPAAVCVGCNLWILAATEMQVFDRIEALPERGVGVLLGTGRMTRGGWVNPHFVNRVQAAAELYCAGKIKHILVSGDNHVKGYDEPTDMKDALMAAGVPEQAITLDYAGFRTLDSIVRAKKVFGLNQFTVISGRFHNYRALFIAQRSGINAVAYCAEDVPLRYSLKTKLRECGARFKAVIDLYVLRKKPRLLGEPVTIS